MKRSTVVSIRSEVEIVAALLGGLFVVGFALGAAWGWITYPGGSS